MKKSIFVILSILCISLLISACLFVAFFIPETTKSEEPYNFPLVLPVVEAKEEEPIFLKLFDDVKQEFISTKTNFIEVNLEEMKVRIYQEDSVKVEFSILNRGDPDGWGGSAVGIYNIISGYTSGYSVFSELYMPYALNYYGKYWLHGEPYYYWGEKFTSSYSGGCVRLKDEDAKTIYELVEIGMPVLVIDRSRDSYDYTQEETVEFPEGISAESYLVADLDSGYVLAKKDHEKQLPIASLTKLMTAIVVVEKINLKKSVIVIGNMFKPKRTVGTLEAGKRFRIVELLYPLLVESSDDAAEALSRFFGEPKTIDSMNEKAKAILMEQTEFIDTSGSDSKNISTAQDIFYLARYLLNNRPPILKITKSEKVLSFGGISFDIGKLQNKNIFIDDPTFVGGKTGDEHNAFSIFRFTAKDDVERNIVIVVLGSEDNKTDTQEIYKWIEKAYFSGGE